MGEDKTLSAEELYELSLEIHSLDINKTVYVVAKDAIAKYRALLRHISAQSAAIKAGEEKIERMNVEAQAAFSHLEKEADKIQKRLRTLLEAPSDEVVNECAKAMCDVRGLYVVKSEGVVPFDARGDAMRALIREAVRAALSALNKAGQTRAFTEDKQT